MTETLPEQLNQLPEPPLTGLAKVRADLSNFTKEMFGQTEAKEKEISSKEVADIAYEDFKHKLLDKKNAEGKQFYSAQLLGTLDFLGETLLHTLFEKKHEGGIRNKLSTLRQLPAVMTSLSLAGISKTEKSLFTEDLKNYLDKLPNIATKADLETLKSQTQLTAGTYTTTVDTQLETQVQTQVSAARTQYIEAQKKANTSRSETSLIVPGRIGTLPKSLPICSEPFERSNKGTTLCSRTAWKNGQNFGINLPRGDAFVAKDLPPISSAFQQKITEPHALKSDFSALAPESNFADVYTTSKSRYGHRAIAYLNQSDRKWYVLDPYTSGGNASSTTKTAPLLLSEYQKQREIIQANFYTSEYYVA